MHIKFSSSKLLFKHLGRSIKNLFPMLALTSYSGLQWNIFKPKVDTKRSDNLLFAKIYPLSSSGVEGMAFTAYLKPINDGSLAQYQIVEPKSTHTQSNEPKKLIQSQFQSNTKKIQKIGSNINQSVNVLQCSGVTCPKNATNCKIVERSEEPNHEKIITTVFCMDDDGKTVTEEKREEINPEEGNPVNSSQTVSRNQNMDTFDSKQDGSRSKSTMMLSDMQKNMKNMFSGTGNNFFGKNPFISSMNMSNFFNG